MSHMLTRSTRPARAARPAPASEVAQCRGLPAADAGQRQLAQCARQAQSGVGAPLPEGLQSGIEGLSGMAMDDVRVHRNSAQPERIGALAFAQGRDIHLAPGQEHHLPHEAWHVVQQAQGRVAATRQHAGGTAVNDDPALEREADAMGQAALAGGLAPSARPAPPPGQARPGVVQRVGAPKVAIRLAEGLPADDPLGVQLVQVFSTYRKQVRTGKRKAEADFTGHEKEFNAQTRFAKALASAEVDAAELTRRIRQTRQLEVTSGKVTGVGTEKTKAVGEILQGNDAYRVDDGRTEATVQTIFRKFDAGTEGGFKKLADYIRVQGRMLRRHAYRGITAHEIEQIDARGDVHPYFHDDTARSQSESGLHFEGAYGYQRERTDAKLDLAYLKSFANVDSVAPSTFGFVHGRRGANKFFSLRSTPGDITSNHGASFSSFGEIKIDLAQVPESAFVFHYAGGGAAALSSGVDPTSVHDKTLHNQEVQRARESVLRNREVILKSYPANAVSWVHKPVIDKKAISQRGYDDGVHNRPRPTYVLYAELYDAGRKRGEAWSLGRHVARKGYAPAPKMKNDLDYMAGYAEGLKG